MSGKLEKLLTDLGERSTYDAASQCSRCGYCEQSCPTYVATGREGRSPRGRNQLVRLMIEDKLADAASAHDALSTCLLCGACATACYAHVPTADIVLEGRRALRGPGHWFARALSYLITQRPQLLARLLKCGYAAKRLGISKLGRPFLRLVGLSAMAEADAHVNETPSQFLFEILRRRPSPINPKWHYFAACGPNYLYPRVGQATVEALDTLNGPVGFSDNACCGLLAYNYGELADAQTLAQRNIEKAEAQADVPIVVDCSSCAAFLKSYPQLFASDPQWRARAERFSARIQDALEVFAVHVKKIPTAHIRETAVYHDSCRACHGQGFKAEPRVVMEAACGSHARELAESDVCCGGAGAFAFTQPELSDDVLRRKIGNIAAAQARLVVTSSTSCLAQLAHGLRKYYPDAVVIHISELMVRALNDLSDGTSSGT